MLGSYPEIGAGESKLNVSGERRENRKRFVLEFQCWLKQSVCVCVFFKGLGCVHVFLTLHYKIF